MNTRRGFLGSILALAAAPAIVRAESLMPVVRPIWVPPADEIQFLVRTLEDYIKEARDFYDSPTPTRIDFRGAGVTADRPGGLVWVEVTEHEHNERRAQLQWRAKSRQVVVGSPRSIEVLSEGRWRKPRGTRDL
jgi:hypothetical protein